MAFESLSYLEQAETPYPYARNMAAKKAHIDPDDKKQEGVKIKDPLRVLWFHLLSLNHYTSLKVAMDLGLIKEEDEGLEDEELFKQVFLRAREQNLLVKLWERVEQEYSDDKYPENPFAELDAAARFQELLEG